MPDSDKEIVSEWEEAYKEAITCWDAYLEQAHQDLRFYVGDQFTDKEKTYLERQGRNALVYNKIKRVVNHVCGYQRRNRLGLACEPQLGNDIETADINSRLLNWAMVKQQGYHRISQAFKGSTITGLNLLNVWMDFSEDKKDGDVRIGREPYNAVLLDPYWSGDPTLSDCRFITRRRYASADEIAAILPDQRKFLKSLKARGGDGKYQYMTYSRKGVGNLLAYDEYWKTVQKPAKLLVNSLNGEMKIFNGTERALQGFLNDRAAVELPNGIVLQVPFKEFVKVSDTTIKDVQLNVIVENELMYSGPDPWGLGEYPFVPVVGYYDPEYDDFGWKLQGIVRCMRDPQTDLNRQRSKLLDMINSQASTGWMYKEGSVKNPLDLYKTGQGVQIVTSKDSQPGDLQPIQPRDIPGGWFSYTQVVDQDINGLSGVTDENLGLVDSGSQISGTAIKLRLATGVTTVSELFDNLDISQAILGKKMLRLMQTWDNDKIERITGKVPSKEFRDRETAKYDIIVKETDLTDTQRTLSYVQALQARALGISIPERYIIETMPIADKSELLQAYDQEKQEQQQMVAKQQEVEELHKGLQRSKIVSDLSLAAERRSRMVADEALARERLSEAQLDRARTVLESIKAGKELQEQDLRILSQTMQFISTMQEQMREQNRQDVAEASRRALAEVSLTSQMDLGEAEQMLPVPQEPQMPG